MKMMRRTSSEGRCVGWLEPRLLPGPCCGVGGLGLEDAIVPTSHDGNARDT